LAYEAADSPCIGIFPDPVLTGLLEQIGPAGADMWGGEPWGT
jgi:hypothetical protein